MVFLETISMILITLVELVAFGAMDKHRTFTSMYESSIPACGRSIFFVENICFHLSVASLNSLAYGSEKGGENL